MNFLNFSRDECFSAGRRCAAKSYINFSFENAVTRPAGAFSSDLAGKMKSCRFTRVHGIWNMLQLNLRLHRMKYFQYSKSLDLNI